jgi:hypothetical protein
MDFRAYLSPSDKVVVGSDAEAGRLTFEVAEGTAAERVRSRRSGRDQVTSRTGLSRPGHQILVIAGTGKPPATEIPPW